MRTINVTAIVDSIASELEAQLRTGLVPEVLRGEVELAASRYRKLLRDSEWLSAHGVAL